jgi:hypothetical protein
MVLPNELAREDDRRDAHDSGRRREPNSVTGLS